jgi:hypothetical protein
MEQDYNNIEPKFIKKGVIADNKQWYTYVSYFLFEVKGKLFITVSPNAGCEQTFILN